MTSLSDVVTARKPAPPTPVNLAPTFGLSSVIEPRKSAVSAAVGTVTTPVIQSIADAGNAIGGVISESIPEEIKQPLKDSGSAVLDTLSNLYRPRNAVATPAKHFGDDMGWWEGLKQGFSQEDVVGAQDVLSKEFRTEHPAQATTFGITGDILTDPLTWTPATVFTTPYKLLGALAKATGVSKLSTRIADK